MCTTDMISFTECFIFVIYIFIKYSNQIEQLYV